MKCVVGADGPGHLLLPLCGNSPCALIGPPKMQPFMRGVEDAAPYDNKSDSALNSPLFTART